MALTAVPSEVTLTLHPLTAPTPTSPNAAVVLDLAIACAGSAPVGSEHLLWALFNAQDYQPRVLGRPPCCRFPPAPAPAPTPACTHRQHPSLPAWHTPAH